MSDTQKHSCSNCAFSIFDETWGEYKCDARKVRIPSSNLSTFCGLYISKKKGVK